MQRDLDGPLWPIVDEHGAKRTMGKPGALTHRRATLGFLAGGAAALYSSASRAHAMSSRMSFDNARENVRTMARLTSTLEPEATGFVRYRGKAFGLMEDGGQTALYDIDGVGALRALPQPNGAIRFLFAEFALYLDSVTGLPLDRWRNPVTGAEVEVWHQRNGPVNYELAPDSAMFGAFSSAQPAPAPGFQLPWIMRGPFATFSLDVISNRPNPLDPAEWPLESSGPNLKTSEHSQYAVLRRDVENPQLNSLPFFASLQSLKPWHPWMLMGQRTGRVFTRMIAEKVPGPEVLPKTSYEYAKTNLSEYMSAPAAWTGQYVSAHTIYKSGRIPQR